jgi:hypothetical protein
MKKIILLLCLSLVTISCKEKVKDNADKPEQVENVKQEKEVVSLIDHPYVFEKDGYSIDAFTSTEVVNAEKFLISLTISGDTQQFEKDHRVFVFGFDQYEAKENDKTFSFTMTKFKKEKGKLIFYKEITPKELSYKSVRFGIANTKEKSRLFVLKLKDVVF